MKSSISLLQSFSQSTVIFLCTYKASSSLIQAYTHALTLSQWSETQSIWICSCSSTFYFKLIISLGYYSINPAKTSQLIIFQSILFDIVTCLRQIFLNRLSAYLSIYLISDMSFSMFLNLKLFCILLATSYLMSSVT